jgi:protein-tyrosine phosphatase
MVSVNNSNFHKHRSKPFTDIHCHCLHGLDDGPVTITDSLDLCRNMAGEGIAKVVATPHQLGRFDGQNEAKSVRHAVYNLNESLRSSNVCLEVVPGAEVRVDERLRQLLDADKILTLADSRKYLLLELPHQIFIDIEPLIGELASMGIESIIGHPEKNSALLAQSKALRYWLDMSAHLQITAASLVGDFGPAIKEAAWGMLSAGWASLIATDAHDLNGRRPRMRDAFNLIRMKLGENLAHLLCVENPSRVVNGQELLRVSICNQKER